MPPSCLRLTIPAALILCALASMAQAYGRTDSPLFGQADGTMQADTIGAQLHDAPLAGYLHRTVPDMVGPRVAQAADAVMQSPRPRPRPAQQQIIGLVGENSALGEPVTSDASGAIIRPRPRTAPPTGTAEPERDTASAPDPAPAGVVGNYVQPVARPEAFGQSIRAAETSQQIEQQQQENEGSFPTATVTTASQGDNRLSLDRITLIGVFGTDDARRALLRMPSGDFMPVARGTEVDGWRVLAVDRTTVRIGRGSEVLLLELP